MTDSNWEVGLHEGVPLMRNEIHTLPQHLV